MSEAHHAKIISPSAAHRRLNCIGSLAMEEGLPDSSSPHAVKGTCEHALAAHCLINDLDPWDFYDTMFQFDDHGIQCEMHLDYDMVERVDQHCTFVSEQAVGGILHVEKRVNFSKFVEVEGQFGTVDAYILFPEQKRCVTIDYKSGRTPVYADCEQLKLYNLGILQEHADLLLETFENYIVQPLVHSTPDRHVVSTKELLIFSANTKRDVREAIEVREIKRFGGNIEECLTPSEKACQWCKAKGICPKLQSESLSLIAQDDDFENLDEQLQALSEYGSRNLSNLGDLVSRFPLLEKWMEAKRDQLYKALMAGGEVQGWKVVQGKPGNRAWADEQQAEEALKALRLKQDEMYVKRIISPTQAERLLKKDSPKKWAKVEELITRADGGLTIAPASDKRPAISVQPVEELFVDVEAYDLGLDLI
jgi:hypothetical protein